MLPTMFRTIGISSLLICMTVNSLSNPLGEPQDIQVRGNNPLKDGLNAWYYGLDTALGGYKYIGDVVDKNTIFHNFKGEPVQIHSASSETAKDYENSHNHYQSLFVQTTNQVPNVNAVAIWGDSTSIVDGAKSWGGFLSARSSCASYVKGAPLQNYGEPSQLSCDDVDNQLIGLEIDVLNSSKAGVYPNMSKTGLQVVGFGNPNSMAIEVRSEDTDRLDASGIPRGAFESALYVKNSIQPEYGRLVVADFDKASIGLDFRRAFFSHGAMQFKSNGIGTGLIVNEGKSGEIYGGKRWPLAEDDNEWLTARAGNGGIRIANNDNTKEMLAIDNNDGIYLNGDIYINGNKIFDKSDSTADRTQDRHLSKIDRLLWLIVILLLISNTYLLFRTRRIR